MPGLTIFVSDKIDDQKRFESQIISIENAKLIYQSDFARIAYEGYSSYPFTMFEDERHLFILEGRLYNQKGDIKDIISKLFGYFKQYNVTSIKKWLLQTDGDFVIVVVNKKSGEIYLLNDPLLRLPLYYSKKGSKTIYLSRQIQNVNKFMQPDSDKWGIAGYLLFGFSLGQRTLFKNVSRILPGSLVYINPASVEMKIINVQTFNFDEKHNDYKNINDAAEHLAQIFTESCKNIYDDKCKSVLSLSGGVDSRAALFGLMNSKHPFEAVTMRNDKPADADSAKLLSERYNFKLTEFNISNPKSEDFKELLANKMGLNYLAMANIVPFFRSLNSHFNQPIQYVTGDFGGHHMLGRVTSRYNIKTLDDALTSILNNGMHAVFPVFSVSQITQLSEESILDMLRQQLKKYPEQDICSKMLHFRFYEFVFNWMGEGEDRNRFYQWSVTPLSSIRFFQAAMNCPDSWKNKLNLYRLFLQKLSPDILTVPVVGGGEILNLQRSIFKKAMDPIKDLLIDSINNYMPTLMKSYLRDRFNAKDISCFTESAHFETLLHTLNLFPKWISQNNISQIKKYTPNQFYNLYTILSFMDIMRNK